MKQKLEHGMKVRANKDTYGVNSGTLLFGHGSRSVVTSSRERLKVSGRVIWDEGLVDLTDRFDIISDPITAEEALSKIMRVLDDDTFLRGELDRIIDEYKKGQRNG